MDRRCQLFFIIFGANGDLTKRKLLPALHNLLLKNKIPEDTRIIATGRRPYTRDEYLKQLEIPLRGYLSDGYEEKTYNKLLALIDYQIIEFSDIDTFIKLKSYLMERRATDNTDIKVLYYMATAPEYFETISDKLSKLEIAEGLGCGGRAVFEKPFGRSLESAEKLNKSLRKVFKEEGIFRIDHYLGKEMLQNILYIRFANTVFEPLWNKDYIESIQIISEETNGIGSRGEYYEEAGALKDMVQNHLMQMLALVAMEPPKGIDSENIRNEKVNIFSKVRLFSDNLQDCVVRGQYKEGEINSKAAKGYRNEDKVDRNSMTETYIALRIGVENERWKGVPITLIHGKRMPETKGEIRIYFKKCCSDKYFSFIPPSNVLIIKVQPEGGVYFSFNAKKAGIEDETVPVSMEYCHTCDNIGNIPEAYERLLYDTISGDRMLFTRWDELKATWKFTDYISDIFKRNDVDLIFYKAGERPGE